MSNLDSGSIFHAEARIEYVQASEYYRAISPTLARQFVTAFKDLIGDLVIFPEAAPLVHSMGVRRKMMKKFPYQVFYLPEPDAIFIVAVSHESRHPDYWLHRLEEPGRER